MTTDIRKGDLVKATLRTTPEETSVFRVEVPGTEYQGHVEYLSTGGYFFSGRYFDFEVLERPIEEELLMGAAAALAAARQVGLPWQHYAEGVKAVIEFVRQYDKENSK